MKDIIVKGIIENNDLHKSLELDLSNLGIDIIPMEVFQLTHLVVLRLENNRIYEIPKEIEFLKNLESIYLKNNCIHEIPEEVSQLPKLKSIDLTDNPIKNPPIEIVNRGIKVIKNYFQEIKGESYELNEAKLILVGEAGAGKTTLSKLLINSQYQLDSNEKSTEGISINSLSFKTDKSKEFKVNIWDFGGQEIYHGTHKIFLTKRSLYVLVTDNRKEDTNFTYWLQVIDVLSSGCPVIIIQNEKDNRIGYHNISFLKQKYDNLHSVHSVNLMNKKGLGDVISDIENTIVTLPHIGSILPKAWIDIRNSLQVLSQKNHYIDQNLYFDICGNCGVKEREKALYLSEYFHDIGVFLHFQDNPILKHIIILNPAWSTDAVYKILDNRAIIQEYGRFALETLSGIWDQYKINWVQGELLELMKKFELCYQIENSNEYIVPQLLAPNQPDFFWETTHNVILEYDYDFLPKGIISRFIIRMNRYILDHSLVWRDGVVLTRENAKAKVVQDFYNRRIRINVNGSSVYQRELLTIIIEELDKLNSSFNKINVTKLIPCNCSACRESDRPEFYTYEMLMRYLDNRKNTIECRVSFEMVPVSNLLGDFLPKTLPAPDEIEKTFNKIKEDIILSIANQSKSVEQ